MFQAVSQLRFRQFATAALLSLCSCVSSALELDNDASSVSFSSTKNSSITEQHHFKQLYGGIDQRGLATLHIDLASVETNIEIRNERLQKMLFETVKFPVATIVTQINMAELAQLKPGDKFNKSVKFRLALHGITRELNSQVQIEALEQGKVQVSSIEPLRIDAAEFSLVEGIDALQAIAKLSSIDTTVPVEIKLVYTP